MSQNFENHNQPKPEIQTIPIGDTEIILDAAGVAGGELTIKHEGGDKIAILRNLGVHPDYRGQGLGSAIFEQSLSEAQKRGCDYFLVAAANERTAKLADRVPADRLRFVYQDKDTKESNMLRDFSVETVVGALAAYRTIMSVPDTQEQASTRPDDQLDIVIHIEADLRKPL